MSILSLNFRDEQQLPLITNKILMAHQRSLIAPLSRLGTSSIAITRPETSRFPLLSYQAIRCASSKPATKRKKKTRNTFIQYDTKRAEQFSLIDAMQYASIPEKIPIEKHRDDRKLTDGIDISAPSKSGATHRPQNTKYTSASAPSKMAQSSEIECAYHIL